MTQINKYSNFIDNLIYRITTQDPYYCDYMIFPKEESQIDRDYLVEAIENNPKLSDRHRRVLEYMYNKNMKYKDIVEIEGISETSVRYANYRAINIIMQRYFVIKADREKNWTYLQDLDLSGTTFRALSRKNIVLIRDMYDKPYLIKEMNNNTKAKKEIIEALKSRGFGLTVFK